MGHIFPFHVAGHDDVEAAPFVIGAKVEGNQIASGQITACAPRANRTPKANGPVSVLHTASRIHGGTMEQKKNIDQVGARI